MKETVDIRTTNIVLFVMSDEPIVVGSIVDLLLYEVFPLLISLEINRSGYGLRYSRVEF